MLNRATMLCAVLAMPVIDAVAQAQTLKIVEVNAPKINCVFQTDCNIPVSDSTGTIGLPFLATPKTAWMQSRTYSGEPGAPGAGTIGYEYRLSMTQASGAGCVLGLNLNFGPHKALPFATNAPADVFVITSGGLGTIGLKSAVRSGDVIQFELASPLCADGPPGTSKTTFFFGLAGINPPMHVSATAYGIGDPAFFAVDARVPTHSVPNNPSDP
jgi:hypothetical protein